MAKQLKLELIVDDKGTLTVKQFGQNAQQSFKAAEAAGVDMAQALSGARKVMLELAAAAGVAFGVSQIVSYAKEAVSLAARYETLGVVMKVVGNNAGYTGTQMEEFAKGLEKTGISMTGARQSLTQMVQAHLDLSKATELARLAQDAAVIGNLNSSEAFQRLVYGIQSAQVEVLRTIGINTNFENSYAKVAKQAGRTVDSFSETEKATIRLNSVLEAGTAISGAYKEAMETAGKQLLSLARHFENIKVMAGAAFTPALAEIIETITGAVTGLSGELSGESKRAIEEWGTRFRISLISIEADIMRLAMFIDKLGGTLTSAGMLLSGPFAALNIPGYKADFEKFAQWNLEFQERYKKTEEALVNLAQKQIDLEESLTEAGRARAEAARQVLESKRLEVAEAKRLADAESERQAKAAAAAKKFVEDMAKVEKDAYIKEMELFGEREKEAAKYLEDQKKNAGQYQQYGQLYAELKQWVEDVRTSGKVFKKETDTAGNEFFKEVVGSSANVAMAWGELIIQIANLVKDFINLPMRIMDAVSGVFNAIGDWGKNFRAAMQGLISSIHNMLRNLPDIINGIKDGIIAFIKEMPTFIKELINAIPQVIQALIAAIPEIAAAFISELPAIAKAFVDALIDALSPSQWGGPVGDVFGGIGDFIGDIGSSIGDVFGFHRGGLVGYDAPSFARTVPALAFAGAPRLHSGFAPDEFPAILQRGERVLSRRENKAYERIGGNTYIIQIEGNVIADDDFIEYMFNRLKQLEAWGH